MLKVKIVISLVFCILLGFIHAQEIKYEEAAYNLINEVYDNKGHHSFISKKVLHVDWEEYLDIDWLNKNNSGIDKFFEPINLELSEEDLKFMRKQASDNKFNRWKKRHVKSFELIGERGSGTSK